MKHKTKLLLILVIVILMGISTPKSAEAVDHAEFAANEDKYKTMCLVNVKLENTKVCGEFQKYLNEKVVNQKKEIDSITDQISDVKANIVEHTKKLSQYEMEIEKLTQDITLLDESIHKMEENIAELEIDITEKQSEVDRIDELVKARMQSTLSSYFVSDRVSFLFGASNFAQFIQRAEILNTISEYDKEQMDELEILRDQLNQDKEALEQQKKAVEENLENVKLAKQSKEKLQKATKDIVKRYRQEESKLMEAEDRLLQTVKLTQAQQSKVNNSIQEALRKEAARIAEEKRKEEEARKALEAARKAEEEARKKAEAEAIKKAEEERQKAEEDLKKAESEADQPSDTPINASGRWVYPVRGSFRVTAGAWNYPSSFSSAPHYGVDIAASVGTPIQSVQPGIVVKAQTGCPVYGYLGNTCNYGSGNSVQIVHAVKGKLYRTSYAHLQSVRVSVGQMVSKGQMVGTLGSSGNSSGPHLHHEVHLIGHGTLENFSGDVSFIPKFASNRCENNGSTPPCYIKPDSWYGLVVGRYY